MAWSWAVTGDALTSLTSNRLHHESPVRVKAASPTAAVTAPFGCADIDEALALKLTHEAEPALGEKCLTKRGARAAQA